MTTATTVPPIDNVLPNVTTRATEGSLGAWKPLLGVGGVAMIASLIGAFSGEAKQFYFSYLVAFMFSLSLGLGALFFVMIQHLARAGWSVVVRRVAENMAAQLPWLAILFIPIAYGADDIYHHWMHAEITDETAANYDKIVAGKSGYLNEPFFYGRMIGYFVIWALLSRYFTRTSLKQDESGDAKLTSKMADRAAPGMVLFALTLTFAAIDWMMSIDPHWFSTMFGVCYFAGSFMSAVGLMTLILLWLGKKGYLKGVVNVEHYHDLGKLLFAFMVFWTYVNFSQFMLIHYADIPEETAWFKHRLPWENVWIVVMLGHFFVPFAFLMSRHVKRNPTTLAIGAVLMLIMHWLDMVMVIMPNHHHAPHFSWIDISTWIAVFCIFLGLVLRTTASRPLLPLRDPRLPESLKFHNI